MDLSKNAEMDQSIYSNLWQVLIGKKHQHFWVVPYVKHQHVRSIPTRLLQGCRLVGTAWGHFVGFS